MAEKEGLHIQTIVFTTIISVVLLFVIMVGAFAWTYSEIASETRRKAASYPRGRELARTRAEQQAALHSVGWANQSEQRVKIPIERAMQLVVDEHASN